MSDGDHRKVTLIACSQLRNTSLTFHGLSVAKAHFRAMFGPAWSATITHRGVVVAECTHWYSSHPQWRKGETA